MAKILLVEDDNNLREIYEARLQAEGYEIAAAKDGEEALVVAKKEQPDLIIADVMMPRVSGFEMLDILRNTEGLKNVHVIMLTALGQAEDKTRADSLGADRYLVKSQVTLEDIVKTAADVLAGAPAGAQAAAAAVADATPAATTANIPVATPPADASAPGPTAPSPEPPTVTPTVAPVPVATPPTDTAAPAAPAADATAPVSPTPTPTGPPATPPVSTPADTAATDTQLVNDAVKDLVAGSQQQDTPVSTTAPTVTPPAPEPATPATPPVPPTPAPVMPPAPPPTVTPPLPQPPQTTMQPVLPPAPVTPPPAPVATPTPPAPVPAPTPAADDPTNDSAPVAKKKTIQPLAAGTTTTPPDIHELLAREGMGPMSETEDTHPVQPPYSQAAHPPGHVISPGANGGPAAPTDPNSISL